MKHWSWFLLLAAILLSACGELAVPTETATMPLPGSELTKVAQGPALGAEQTASPTSPPTSTATGTPPPTSTATPLPTLTSPPTDLPTATPTNTALPSPLPSETATLATTEVSIKVDKTLKFKAEDGLEISGTLYTLEGAPLPLPGVIILPMHIEDQSAWKPFARQLALAGYAALTIDPRGQGQTGGAIDWQKAAADVRLVWREFGRREEVDEARTALLGASMGANLALVAASSEPGIKTVVLISPGLEYNGVGTLEAIGAYGPRPIMLIGSKSDPIALNGAVELSKLAQGEVALKEMEGSLHGTALFINEPSLAESILRFLEDKVKSQPGAQPQPAGPGYGWGSLLLGVFASLAGTVLIGASVIMAYNRLSKPSQARELMSLPEWTPLSEPVLIKGLIASAPQPLDKDEAKALVGLRLLIEEHDPEKGWSTRLDELKATPFWLHGGRGKVWVSAEHLEKTQLGEGYYATTKQAEQALEVLGKPKNTAWGKGLRYRIWELRVGQKISARGLLQPKPELVSTPNQPLVITPLASGATVKPPPVISGKSRIGTIVVMLVVGAALLCLGSAGVVNTLVYWLS